MAWHRFGTRLFFLRHCILPSRLAFSTTGRQLVAVGKDIIGSSNAEASRRHELERQRGLVTPQQVAQVHFQWNKTSCLEAGVPRMMSRGTFSGNYQPKTITIEKYVRACVRACVLVNI